MVMGVSQCSHLMGSSVIGCGFWIGGCGAVHGECV